MQISTLPALGRGPPAKHTVPLVQHWAAMGTHIKNYCTTADIPDNKPQSQASPIFVLQFVFRFCVLYKLRNKKLGRPGNEAIGLPNSGLFSWAEIFVEEAPRIKFCGFKFCGAMSITDGVCTWDTWCDFGSEDERWSIPVLSLV